MRSLPPLRPAGLAALLAAGALGAAAGPVAAESITYIDGQTHNVWAENVDGSQRRQLTSDATATLRYSFPSMNDNGDMAVLLRETTSSNVSINFFPRGGERIMNIMPAWGVGVTAPFNARLQPGGRLLTYSFGRFHLGGQTAAGNVVPADAPGSPTQGPGFPNMLGATWHGDKLVWTNLEALAYGDGSETTAWITGASFGEVSRDASRLLALLTNGKLAYQALKGPMPSQVDDAVGGCFVPATGTITADVALAPSGRWVAFRDGNGLNIAQIEIPAGETESCTLTNVRTIGGGAEDPAFSAFTFAPAQQPPQEQPRDGGPTDPPRDRGGNGGGGRPAAPKATVGRATLKGALKQGLAVKLSGMKKGRTTVTAKLGRKVLASARVNVGASGRATLRLRFTAAGRRTLKRRKRAKLTIVAGKAKTTVTLR